MQYYSIIQMHAIASLCDKWMKFDDIMFNEMLYKDNYLISNVF